MMRRLARIFALLGIAFLPLAASAMGLPPDVEIARFLYDRPAAYSLTFDDGLPSHVEDVIPVLDRHNLKGTFFVFTDNIKEGTASNWEAWRRIAASGHEVGSHSCSHLDMVQPVTREILDHEIAGSHRIIAEQTGIAPVSFAYPFSSKNDFVKRLVMETYAFDRADCRVWGGDGFTVQMGIDQIERTIAQRTWEYVMLHGVGVYSWGALDLEMLEALCQYLEEQQHRIWTDTYARVSTYIRKRNAAQVRRRAVTRDGFSFQLRLPDRPEFQNLPEIPLTVRIPLEGRKTKGVRGDVDGQSLAVRVSDDGQYLLAEVPVDGRWVTIKW